MEIKTCIAQLKDEKVAGMVDFSRKMNGDGESLSNGVELKMQAEVKLEAMVFTLNAKIKEEKDPALSATAGWEAVRAAGDGAISCDDYGANHIMNNQEKAEFDLDSDGSLLFYILDGHEGFYGANAGNLYLFGKVKSGETYHSCCVVVKIMQRCVYAIPNVSVFHSDSLMNLQSDVEESQIPSTEFGSQLHVTLSNDVALCIQVHLAPAKVSGRNYALERSDIPRGECYAQNQLPV